MDELKKLIDVKTIVTFSVTAVFIVLALRGSIGATDVKEIALLIFTFFFAKKASDPAAGGLK